MNVRTLEFNNGNSSNSNEYGIIQARTMDGLFAKVEIRCYYKLNNTLQDVVYIYKNYTEVYKTTKLN